MAWLWQQGARGAVFGALTAGCYDVLYGPLSVGQHLLVCAGSAGLLLPLSAGVGWARERLAERVTFREFKTLYAAQPHVYRSYVFNRRLMAVEFVVGAMAGQLASYLLLHGFLRATDARAAPLSLAACATMARVCLDSFLVSALCNALLTARQSPRGLLLFELGNTFVRATVMACGLRQIYPPALTPRG